VTTKPFFREVFKRTRCIIPASGYYDGRIRQAASSRTTSRAPMAK
jgi:putative SOS response-associated peptidase YedK